MDVTHASFELIDQLIEGRKADLARYRRDRDKVRWQMTKNEIKRLEGLKEAACDAPEIVASYAEAERVTGYEKRQLRRKLTAGILTNAGRPGAPRFLLYELEQNRKPGYTPPESGTDISPRGTAKSRGGAGEDFDADATADDMLDAA